MSPPWCGNRSCEDNPHTFAHDHRADNQERLASAHRGRSNVTAPEFAGVRSAVSQTFMQTPLQVRFRGTTEGLHPPLIFARVRPPTGLRLFRCTNAQSALGAAGVSPPLLGESRGRHDYAHIRTQSSDG